MKQISTLAFDQWLAAYSRASAENDPRASAMLFADDACYYENPFAQPISGRRAIYDYWAEGAVSLSDKRSAHEVMAVHDNLGMAHWQSRFVVKASGAAISLDCIFLAEFNARGECRIFREWWHSHQHDSSTR